VSNLSRRSLVASAAALPALAVPAMAALPVKPTRIAKLWAAMQEAKRVYEASNPLIERIEAEVESQLPEPHPSIANIPENFCDGVEWDNYYEGKRSIHNSAFYPAIKRVREEIEDRPDNLPELQARLARLEAREKLAEEYDELRRKAQNKTKLRGLYEEHDELIEPVARLQSIIEKAPPKSRGDLEMKLAIYADHCDDNDDVGNPMLRDLRLLLNNPSVLTTA
jgi:hypothetical protein